jgi:hypothetical protein
MQTKGIQLRILQSLLFKNAFGAPHFQSVLNNLGHKKDAGSGSASKTLFGIADP